MRRSVPIVLCTVLLAASAHAQKSITSGVLVDRDGTALEIRSVFDPLPPTGYAPLRIVVTNGSDQSSRWRFSFRAQARNFRSEHTHQSRLQFDVPAHETHSATFMLPLAVAYGSSSVSGNNRHELRIDLKADGVGERSFNHYDSRVYDFPAIAISKALADTNQIRLQDEVEQRMKSRTGGGGSGVKMFGSLFAPEDLPEDWRGLSGFDVLMITSTEWQLLKPGQQLAVTQWTRLGGQLDVYAGSTTLMSALGIPIDSQNRVSFGQVNLLNWDGKDLDAEATVARHWSNNSREKELKSEYAGHKGSSPNSLPEWGLLESLGLRNFASWQVIVFLVIFGILVGPVNLFLLAPHGRRHRLFITTPLLSLGASVLMFGIILFQDGIGGIGARLVVINIVPGEASAYVTQEQASRTGVIFGGGFELKQPTLIEPLALPDTPWVKLKDTNNTQAVQLKQEGSQRSGNYFQNRAEQGQILRAVVSTRARLELKSGLPPDATPEVISALGFSIDTLFYVDAKGRAWKAPHPLSTGQSSKLVACDYSELRSMWKEVSELAEGQMQMRLNALINETTARKTFFATAKEAPDFTLDTLSSIRWSPNQAALFGPLEPPSLQP